ncbi:protein FAR1-RELATED SEQUENCE 5-like [Tripterygium wilfordii]|uniref:protein FAR1-RELATED SEQUENCE 5-like n=1 Tax=Tripterygium wilfordii TaxID=458696 RepID=UPI0018F85893|nr:protein FAR1-RELATED SEQUENCE 5-like [Tripterygium wilfordii]
MNDLSDMEQAETEMEIGQTEIEFEEMDFSSSSSNDLNYIPQVRVEKIPKLDQEFESIEEAHTFYNDYAREAGSSSKESFKVSIFHEAHNHVLTTPRKVHLLRSERVMSAAKKSLSQQLSAANVPICQQIGILDLEVGGIENIGCIEKDFYNARRDEMKMYAGHDGQMLYEYFQSEKEKNPEFYFQIKMDTESKITHCFWADIECRKSYDAFGDVVVFDTTYNTNRYGMIFAPFVGVNHHGQTTLFAYAFLSDETTESFSWLLQQLLLSMPIGPPKMIITDQDPAMTKAIAELFPNTRLQKNLKQSGLSYWSKVGCHQTNG